MARELKSSLVLGMCFGALVTLLLFVPVSRAQTTAAPAEARALAAPWFDRAAKEAGAIEDVNSKMAILASLSQAWARAGDVQKFRAALATLEKIERGRADKEPAATAMYLYGGAVQLAPILVRAGQVDEAIALCSKVQGGDREMYGAGRRRPWGRRWLRRGRSRRPARSPSRRRRLRPRRVSNMALPWAWPELARRPRWRKPSRP